MSCLRTVRWPAPLGETASNSATVLAPPPTTSAERFSGASSIFLYVCEFVFISVLAFSHSFSASVELKGRISALVVGTSALYCLYKYKPVRDTAKPASCKYKENKEWGW